MRWIKTVAWVTLAFWVADSVMFIMLFASAFSHIVVQCFVSLGAPMPEANAFLHGTMQVLAWPIHSIFPTAWSDATFVQAILLLGLNSLIWGSVLGTIVFFVARMRRERGTSRLS
jgi:hypothetical protein